MRFPVLQFFFAWAAFVFLPVNVLTGVALAKQVAPNAFHVAIVLGMLLLALSVVPAAMIASQSRASFSGAMFALLPVMLALPIVAIVPLVNIGWFAIQLAALGLLTKRLLPGWGNADICIIAWAIVCAAGPLVFGFRWLSATGAIALLVAVVAVIVEVATVHATQVGAVAIDLTATSSWAAVWTAAWMVYGTWAFSSASCVMDLARFARPSLPTAVAAVLGLLVADLCLIGLGYFLARNGLAVESTLALSKAHYGLAYAFFIAGLWSTNDSNIYSTRIAIRNMGLRAEFWPWLFVGLATVVAITVKDELFNWIGRWLILMGWIAVPLTGWWWFVLLKKKHSNIPQDGEQKVSMKWAA